MKAKIKRNLTPGIKVSFCSAYPHTLEGREWGEKREGGEALEPEGDWGQRRAGKIQGKRSKG